MPRILKIMLFTLVFLLLLGGGLYGYYRWKLSKSLGTSPSSTSSGQPVATDEDDTNVEITKNVLVGKFVRGEEGKIIIEQNGENKEFPTSSGFAFVCTNQIIGSEAVLEYGKVINALPISPSDIVTKINPGEPILVMLNSGDGLANSVVSSRCGVSL